MKNVKLEIINESVKNEKYYALSKISTEEKNRYCVIVQDDELVLQDVGAERGRAKETYELLVRGEVSSVHAEDIISDLKKEIFI